MTPTNAYCEDFDGYLVNGYCDSCHEDQDLFGFGMCMLLELEPELGEVCCRRSNELREKLGCRS